MVWAQNLEPGKKQLRIKVEALEFDEEGTAWYKNQLFSGISIKQWPKNESGLTRTNETISYLNGKRHGEYQEFTEEGILVAKVNYVNGIKEGPFEFYFPNGSKQNFGTFKNGDLDGISTVYYHNGLKREERNYVNGILHGVSSAWHFNGAPEQIVTFDMGKIVGTQYAYFSDSSTRYEVDYKNGVKHGRQYIFHRTGCPAEEAYYKNGKADSIKRVWNESSCLLLKLGHFKDGLKHGTFMDFEQLGDTILIENYQFNQLDGFYRKKIQKEAFTPYELESFGNYKSGKKDGYWYENIASKYQMAEGNYDNGVRIGLWKFYDNEGYLLLEIEYNSDGENTKEKTIKKQKAKYKFKLK